VDGYLVINLMSSNHFYAIDFKLISFRVRKFKKVIFNQNYFFSKQKNGLAGKKLS